MVHRSHDPFAAYRIDARRAVDLGAFDPAVNPCAGDDKSEDARTLQHLVDDIGALQVRLFAEHRRKLLVVLQGMDTSGKDSVTREVFRGIHPLGLRAVAFKTPTPDEAAHDFLWRVHAHAPADGQIAVFNRSHYEAVLADRVQNGLGIEECRRRCAQILDFERMLGASGTTVLKFFLHISRDVQKERLEERLTRLDKHWKFDPADLDSRAHWAEYRHAHEDAISATGVAAAPWWIVPADSRMHRNLMVAHVVRDALAALRLEFPPLPDAWALIGIDADRRARMRRATPGRRAADLGAASGSAIDPTTTPVDSRNPDRSRS